MSMDFLISNLEHLSVHEVGNKNNGGQLYASAESIEVDDESLVALLQHYFFKPFTNQEFWHFTSSNEDVNLNPIYSFAQQIFNQTSSFHLHILTRQDNHFKTGLRWSEDYLRIWVLRRQI